MVFSMATSQYYQSNCYLGITFSISGSFGHTQMQLKQKGLRAYFALKKNINLTSISKVAVFKLFDALVLPVASYGSQVWLTNTSMLRILTDQAPKEKSLSKISMDPVEING